MEKFKIIEEKENPLFRRKEIKASMDSEVSPSEAEVLKNLSEKFSAPAENIKIKKISGKFGSKNFTITANIYSSLKDKELTEPKSKKKGATSKQPPAKAEQKEEE